MVIKMVYAVRLTYDYDCIYKEMMVNSSFIKQHWIQIYSMQHFSPPTLNAVWIPL